MATSSLTQETVATRVGCFSMVVLPNTWSMVTGNCALLEVGALAADVDVAGPVELIDMMEMGCSLGPIDVWVETIERRPAEG